MYEMIWTMLVVIKTMHAYGKMGLKTFTIRCSCEGKTTSMREGEGK